MDSFIENFLETFDDHNYPDEFLQTYEILECLSSNEMGETLLIKERQTGECHVAKCHSVRSSFLPSFEGDLLRNLHHAGLPEFIGKFKNEQMVCVVRTYAQGMSLDRWIKETKPSSQSLIDIVVQLCEILSFLHSQTPPIIHRDIKPQNIIVGENGKVTLIDFGISREYKEGSISDTLCMGTRDYAAPEQYGFAQSDCRTDIYALGVLMCWLITGQVDINHGKRALSSHRLKKVIEKCTAFAPKDRYRNVSEVRNALTGQTLRRKMLVMLGAALPVMVTFFFLIVVGQKQSQQPPEVIFNEPLIEIAVRLTLDKTEFEKITEQDLESINTLYIFGDRAAPDAEVFNQYVDDFANNGGESKRGDIDSLEDLQKMPNLRSVSLAYQEIKDIHPLSSLAYLENVDFRHNPIEDVSPLAQVVTLETLTLFGTHVSDLTSLRTCPHLSVVDIGDTHVESVAALDGLSAMQVLVIRKAPLQSLDHIETHPLLERVYLSETPVKDLSPLLKLENLKIVEISEDMQPVAEQIIPQAQFAIVFP